jgi:hypothetical protein
VLKNLGLPIALAVLVLGAASPARATSTGTIGNCAGCHFGGSAVGPTLAADSSCLTAGMSTTINVSATNPNGATGGMDLSTTAGLLSVGGPNATSTRVNGADITHSAPKFVSGGVVRFSAIFTAPPLPTMTTTTANLHVYVLGANANGSTTGDGTGQANLSLTVAAAPTCDANACGVVGNACGQTVSCGACANGFSCVSSTCVPSSPPAVPALGPVGITLLAALLLGAATARSRRRPGG